MVWYYKNLRLMAFGKNDEMRMEVDDKVLM